MAPKFTKFKEKEIDYPIPFQISKIPFQISNKEDIRDQETLLKSMKTWEFEEYNRILQKRRTSWQSEADGSGAYPEQANMPLKT